MKKILFLLLLVFLFSSEVRSQQNDTANYPYWIEMMQDPSANFFQTQKAFEVFWENKEVTAGCGYKPFKRWEYRMSQIVDESGYKPNTSETFYTLKNYLPIKSVSGNWTPLGPNFNQTTSYGEIPGVGRLNTVAFHPTDPNTIYAGAPAGGLWISNDNGATWNSSTDDMPTLGVSSILIDPINPNIIYIGTGDKDASDAPGLGVFKSIDGGISFNQFNIGMGDRTVNEMRMHPDSNEVLYACTSGGFFRSGDAGLNWTQTTISPTDYIDMEIKPGDPSTIYAVRKNRLDISTDGGLSFSSTFGYPIKNRMLIEVSEADPNRLYLLVTNLYDFDSFWRSDDSGQTFYEVANSPNIMGRTTDGSDIGVGQSWYDLALEVDPENADIVYAGGINVFKSIDGGSSWTYNSNGVHVDMHYLSFSPHTHELYLANDGGLYRSDSANSDWEDISQNMVIGQIYKIGQSPTNVNKCLTGFQDNGTSLFDGIGWGRVLGGDGMECMYDPIDENYAYASIYYALIYRSVNGSGFQKICGLNTNNVDEEGAWVTPYCIGEHNNGVMYAGLKSMWRTTRLKEADKDSVLFENISPAGIGNTSNNCDVIEHSSADSNLLYVTKGFSLYRSDNCNDSATNVNWNTFSPGTIAGMITDMETNPMDTNVIWLAKGNGVIRSDDRGLTWSDISGNLPGIPVTCIVLDNMSNEGLYVGTYAGVYYKDSTMSNWVFFGTGLPINSELSELNIYYGSGGAEKRLRASTYGRGLWESDLYDTTTTFFPSLPLISFQNDNPKSEVYEAFTLNINFYKNLVNVPVSGFDLLDIAITNGTLNSLTGGPIDYELDITPIAPGMITIDIPADIAKDNDSIFNAMATTFLVNYSEDIPNLGYIGPGGVGGETEIAIWLSGDNEFSYQGNAITADGAIIDKWLDRSAFNINTFQTIDSMQPVLRTGTNGIAGLNAIEFQSDTSGFGTWIKAENVTPGKNFGVFTIAESTSELYNDHGWIASSRDDNGFIIHPNKGDKSWYPHIKNNTGDGTNGATKSFNDITIPHLYGFAFCQNDITSFLHVISDGEDEIGGEEAYGARDNSGIIDVQLGQDRSDRWGDGKLAEHFIYNEALGNAHINIIRNYLGAKYQIDLGSNDMYLHDDIYRFNLGGIGRENQFDLHQDAQGTGIVRINNPTSLDNGDYFMWADNNESHLNWIQNVSPFETKMISRIWQVEEVGIIESVDVRIALETLPENDLEYVLLISTQPDFSQNNEAYKMILVDDTLTSTIDFSDDAYFTIIAANDLQIQLINEGYSSLTLNVYPSFSSGEFQVVISDENILEGELTIFNVVGQLIVKMDITGSSTIYRSFNNLASGEYIVRYKDVNNSINQRLIIAK